MAAPLQPWPQMRSIGERRHQEVRKPSGSSGQNVMTCFSGQLFGCSICTVDDSDIFPHGNLRRLGDTWAVEVEGGGSEVDGSEVGAGVAEEESSVEDEDDASSLEDVDLGVPQWLPPTFVAGRHPSEVTIDQEIEALILGTGDAFATKGWELTRLGGDRYAINGRNVRLSLLPLGSPVPSSSHLAGKLGKTAAQRAARLTVHDGPLRQPLLDYLAETGQNEFYDARGTENPVAVTGAARNLEFHVPSHVGNSGDRVEAMKQAILQADMRRQRSAAETRSSSARRIGSSPQQALSAARPPVATQAHAVAQASARGRSPQPAAATATTASPTPSGGSIGVRRQPVAPSNLAGVFEDAAEAASAASAASDRGGGAGSATAAPPAGSSPPAGGSLGIGSGAVVVPAAKRPAAPSK